MTIIKTKRAFFVVGPESSGTRFVKRSFISAGCRYDEAWKFIEEDGWHDFGEGPNIVFHRSIPHAKMIPDLELLRERMENSGFNVIPLLVVRDWNCTILSQLHRGMIESSEEAEEHIRKAVAQVVIKLPDFLLITYEAFCLDTGFREWLIQDKFGLSKPTEPVYFENPKHYGKEVEP